MSPMITKLFMILKSANNITMSPADLKKTPACLLSLILKELKLISAKTGKVPRAKKSIVRPPVRKLFVVRLYSCIA